MMMMAWWVIPSFLLKIPTEIPIVVTFYSVITYDSINQEIPKVNTIQSSIVEGMNQQAINNRSDCCWKCGWYLTYSDLCWFGNRGSSVRCNILVTTIQERLVRDGHGHFWNRLDICFGFRFTSWPKRYLGLPKQSEVGESWMSGGTRYPVLWESLVR